MNWNFSWKNKVDSPMRGVITKGGSKSLKRLGLLKMIGKNVMIGVFSN